MHQADVSDIVLIYSDGTMTKTGKLRGTFHRPIILREREHIVRINQEKWGDDGIVFLHVFTNEDEYDVYRIYRVSADYVRCDIVPSLPSSNNELSVSVEETDHVVTSLTWCPKTNCICHHDTSNKHMFGFAAPRISGFSPFPYQRNGDRWELVVEDSWTLYENNEDYIGDNLVPTSRSKLLTEVERICGRRDMLEIGPQFERWIDELEQKGRKVVLCSNEAYNVCTLAKLVNKAKKDKMKRKRYRKELRRQYKALDRRVNKICSQWKSR